MSNKRKSIVTKQDNHIMHEQTPLVASSREEGHIHQMDIHSYSTRQHNQRALYLGALLAFVVGLILLLLSSSPNQEANSNSNSYTWGDSSVGLRETHSMGLWGSSHRHHGNHFPVELPPLEKRCDLVELLFHQRDALKTEGELQATYQAQSKDPNVFFRATAHLFWHDFVAQEWSSLLLKHKGNSKHTWTWITGDQHLSNFGAWKNRHADLVYGVNDFDEAAIYDFQVDLVRIAVSICNHAETNGFSDSKVDAILRALTDSYIRAVQSYVGNQNAGLFELTPSTTTGKLHKFMKKVGKKRSARKQLRKFTTVDNTTMTRSFLKGPVGGAAHPVSKLAAVPAQIYEQLMQAFTLTHYGASLMKVGWHVRDWDDSFYKVVDIAERVGSGIGSFGTDRYYVLLNGTDDLLPHTEDAAAIILDVKLQPDAAVRAVLTESEDAWYNTLFAHPAERVVLAQRHLTSYTDPFTGWILLNDVNGTQQSFTVRQRSPWKDDMDLATLTKVDDFIDYVEQIGLSTATSHVRGTVGKPPGEFKHVISDLLGKGQHHSWGKRVRELAKWYHGQVLLDFECFHETLVTPPAAETTEEVAPLVNEWGGITVNETVIPPPVAPADANETATVVVGEEALPPPIANETEPVVPGLILESNRIMNDSLRE